MFVTFLTLSPCPGPCPQVPHLGSWSLSLSWTPSILLPPYSPLWEICCHQWGVVGGWWWTEHLV